MLGNIKNELRLEIFPEPSLFLWDTFHTIVVGPAGWNSYYNLAVMPAYADTNLVVTFHFYDPFLFTHQGASWTDPPGDIAGVPFPYDALRMPACPRHWSARGGRVLMKFIRRGSAAHVQSLLDIAVRFRSQRNVPLWCGEFGSTNCTPRPRTGPRGCASSGPVWRNTKSRGPCGNTTGVSDFEKETAGNLETDVDTAVTAALGLTPPIQREPVSKPDTSEFTVYDDFIAHGLLEAGWTSVGSFDLYSADAPRNGTHCLLITGFEQYGNVSFRFSPDPRPIRPDGPGIRAGLMTRCDSPGTQVDIRFRGHEDVGSGGPPLAHAHDIGSIRR